MQLFQIESRHFYITICCLLAVLVGNASAFCAENSTNAIPKKYVSAVIKCEQRLKLAPDNLALRKTLAGHYIKIAQSLKSDPYEAIKFLHKADLLEPDNQSVTDNLNTIIRKMSKNPLSFSDRAEIAAMARRQADFTTAIGEYVRALQIKSSGPMHEQLGDIYRVRDENDKAIEQYIKAQSFGDSKGLEVKLGQAYQAKKDIVSAIAAYAKANAMQSDDPLEQEALVAGWEEALKPVLHPESTKPLDWSAQPQLDFTELSNRIKAAWLPPKRVDFKTAKLSAKFFADGSTSTVFTVEFQHIIGGPKIVLVSL